MLAKWRNDQKWAEGYLPEIKKIIRSVAGEIIEIHTASDEQDQKYATDYMITVSGGNIGCRIRRWEYWHKFGDITIRSRRPSGAKTELQKIREGYVDWYLYAWSKKEGEISTWLFLDMHQLVGSKLLERGVEHHNTDNSSSFISIPLADLVNAGCVVESWGAARKAVYSILNPPVLELSYL